VVDDEDLAQTILEIEVRGKRGVLQLKSTFGWSLSNLVALLRQQLFVYRDLWVWIDNPFQPPPLPEALPEQLPLHLT
jgi:hypothetical protein